MGTARVVCTSRAWSSVDSAASAWVLTEGEGPEATARRREIVKHLEAAGVRVVGLLPGWIGAAVPVGMSDAATAACAPRRQAARSRARSIAEALGSVAAAAM